MKRLLLSIILIVKIGYAQENFKIIGFVKADNTSVYSVPNSDKKYELFKVNKDDSLQVYKYIYNFPSRTTLFWKITHNGEKGFIRNFDFKQTEELIQYKQLLDEKKELRKKKIENERFEKLEKRWGSKIANRIIKKDFWIGMTKEMCKKSLGVPADINFSRGSWGIHEQWIYRKPFKKYLYFENGKLTSYQF